MKKDRSDLLFCIEQGVDFVALSFVRQAEDILLALKNMLYEKETRMQVIAKIERPGSVNEFDSILAAADGIMAARGDLGVEMDLERGYRRTSCLTSSSRCS